MTRPFSVDCSAIAPLSAALAQVAGGLASLSGVLIRLGAACIIIVMLGAIFFVHLSHGFDVIKGGIEYAFTQLLIAIALLMTGAGVYSLAPRLRKPLRKWNQALTLRHAHTVTTILLIVDQRLELQRLGKQFSMWHICPCQVQFEWTNTVPHENALFWVFGTKGSIVRRAVLNVL